MRNRTSYSIIVTFVSFIFCICSLGVLPMQGAESNNSKLLKTEGQIIPNRFIVVLKNDPADTGTNLKRQKSVVDMARQQGATIHQEYQAAIKGFSATLSPAALQMMLQLDEVNYIEPDTIVKVDPINASSSTQAIKTGKGIAANPIAKIADDQRKQKSSPEYKELARSINAGQPAEPGRLSIDLDLWNLDRLDQHSLQRDGWYRRQFDGNGVHVYVIDSGIMATHDAFEGRVSYDFTAVGDGYGAGDCAGHGTHVAGTVGGAEIGVAQKVRIHSVRVLDCYGSGTKSLTIQGIEWVISHRIRPAIINLSLGGELSRAQNEAVQNAINAGITVIVAAGNHESVSSCNQSPGSTFEAITVGATNRYDNVSTFSSAGPCVDILAPGEEIWSASIRGNNWYQKDDGTSYAAPHITGLAAQYLQSSPYAKPDEVMDALLRVATIEHAGARFGEPDFIGHVITTSDCLAPLHRYSTPGNHFYATGWIELGGGRYGYVYEGVMGYVPLGAGCVSNILPIHRYWNGSATDRFYTRAFEELGYGGNGWTYEGVTIAMTGASQYAFGVPSIPMYRYFSPTWTDHFYTTNFGELGRGNAEWLYEGSLGYIFSPSLRR